MGNLLGTLPDNDVTEVLDGRISFSEQALRVRENVALSMARRPTNDPTRYLMNHSTTQRLSEIEAEFQPDFMFFDLPPLLVSDDTRAFLSNVDCVLLVARAEKTTSSEVDICEREIAEHNNMLGVVLNQCRHAGQDGGYGYEGYN